MHVKLRIFILLQTTRRGGERERDINFFFSVTGGFDFARSLEKLEFIQKTKLNNERNGLGNEKSDIILFIPHTSSVSDDNKEYCIQQIKRMREQVPGNVLIVHYKKCKLL